MAKKVEKDDNILVIVESPNKCSHLKKIFKELGYTHLSVEASVGHITEIANNRNSYKNTGIYPDQDFKVDYKVSADKKEVVKKLKAGVDKATWVFLMTDDDREGSAISTHLKQELKIPASKYYRLVTHEITRGGVEKALENLGKIDDNLSTAAECRAIGDKLIGYSYSPVVQNETGNVHDAAGRCQSVGLKVIVDREEEIINFKPETYYELFLLFKKNKVDFKAKYWGAGKKEAKRLESTEAVGKIIKECGSNPFSISDIKKKTTTESPKPPFETSTLQQDANKALGFSVDRTMGAAQKLFEGGYITYLRTDSTSMDPEFLKFLKQYVTNNFGKDFCGELQKGKAANESIGGGHECIRPTNISLNPEEFSTKCSVSDQVRLYKLIWQRTVMSCMSPAKWADTQYVISCACKEDHKFILHSKELIFDGFRKLRTVGSSDDDEDKEIVVKETFEKGEEIKSPKLDTEKKQTTPPARYSEASFIKELDKRGIGRPSTFATIVESVLNERRGLCKVEQKNIVPTEKGIKLSHFLSESFPEIINLNYTAEMENDLDLVAKGELDRNSFLNELFNKIDNSLKNVKKSEFTKTCPECGKPLVKRRSKMGFFWGCSGYPNCRHIEKL